MGSYTIGKMKLKLNQLLRRPRAFKLKVERASFTNSLSASKLSTGPIIFDNFFNLIFCLKVLMGIFLQVKSLSFVEDAIGAHKLEKTAFESNRAFFDHVDKIYSAVSVNYLHRRI